MITKFRRIVQMTILAGIILTVYFHYYENQKVKYGGEAVIRDSVVLRAIDKAVGRIENRTQLITFFKGDVWTAQIGQWKLTDPLAFFGNLIRTKEIYWPLFFSALIPIAATVILGKIFCGWICPMGLLFEWNSRLRRFLKKAGLPLFDFKLPASVKFFVLGGGLLTGLIFGAHYFLIIYPPKLISGEIYLSITRSTLSYGAIFLFTLLAVELVLAPRLWCRSLCPGGALYTLLSRFRFLRIQNDRRRCTDCGICDRACPYEIQPSKGNLSSECDHCGVCIDKCPVNTLFFSVINDREIYQRVVQQRIPPPSKRGREGGGENPLPRWEGKFWKQMVIFLGVFLITTSAHAHHIRGLPHYGYSKNYPQVPTYEESRVVDDWGISFSYIKIFETKNCDLAIYLKNTKTGKPFDGVMSFKVFGEHEDPHDVHAYDAHRHTNTYRVGWVYEKDGIYTLRITFNDGGKTYMEDFRMQMGNVGFNKLWLILPASVVLMLVFLNVIKRLRGKSVKTAAVVLALIYTFAAPALVFAAEKGFCPICGMKMPCPMKCIAAVTGSGGEKMMLMSGMPARLFFTGIALVLIVSFIAVEILIRGSKQPGDYAKFNLLEMRWLNALVKKPYFKFLFQFPVFLVFCFIIYAGLFGHGIINIAPILTWTIWWAGLVFLILFFGKAWCFFCPLDFMATLFQHLKPFGVSNAPFTLGLKWPPWLKNIYLAIGLFILLTWFELGFKVTASPRSTAFLGILMVCLSIVPALIFEKRSFCKYACLVGRISGLYAMFSPVEVRSKDLSVCTACRTKDCFAGNDRGNPCPTSLVIPQIRENTYCILCTECVRSCPHDNVAVNIRPVAADLRRFKTARPDEAWLAVILLALTSFHGLTMTPLWDSAAQTSVLGLRSE